MTLTNQQILDSLSRHTQVLKVRKSYLSKDQKAFDGNSVARAEYLKQLVAIKPQLTPFQMSYLVGLNLSDASVDLNTNVKTARVKIQQLYERKDWIISVREIFLEYVASDDYFFTQLSTRQAMLDCQTLKCTPLYDAMVPLFYPTLGRKSITPAIENWINPVSVAAWLCGDGGTVNTSTQGGKGIEFHSQGFTADENAMLAEMLNRKLGFNARVKKHSTRGYSWIALSGSDYDRFVEVVGPYVHPVFHHRIPPGRSANSRHGFMTHALRDQLLGSALNQPNLLHSYSP